MVEDLGLIRDYSVLGKRKNVICGSKDYVRKAGKLLLRAGLPIEALYCNDEITDSELQNIEKAVFSDVFNLKPLEIYNVICAENNQELMDQNLKQFNDVGHIFTYCGLYISIAVNANKNKSLLKEMNSMNELNTAMGCYDFAAKWLRGIRWAEESGIELILYAMPKTGTQAMKATLNKYGFEHTYIHFLNIDTMLSKQLYTFYNEKIPCLSELLVNPGFVKKNYLNVIKSKKLKIITSVREPIARGYSVIFQGIRNWGPSLLAGESEGDFEQGIIRCLKRNCSSTWDWFEEEIKEVFNIDVFQYPFDKEKGYSVIKKDNVEIFLYRLESSRNLGKALGDFLGTEKNIDMLTLHESKKEEDRFVYEQLKRELSIPETIVSLYYDNDKMRHFYTEKEITDLKNKWGHKEI